MMSRHRNVDYSSSIRAAVKSEVPIIVKEYLGKSLDDALHKALQRHTSEFVKEHSVLADVIDVLQQQQKPQKSDADIRKIKMEQAWKQQEPKYTIHKTLYHALMELILEDEDAMDKGVADKLKKRKPDDDIDEGPPTGPDQGLKMKKTCKETEPSKKAKSTGTYKGTTKSQPKSTGKSAQAKETVFEAGDTQVTQDLREDTNPEWNEGKSVENKPIQKWFCDLSKAEKPLKTFNDMMSTPIDFSAFVMNRLSYVEFDYNMEECYKALTDQLDWNNPEDDRYPFDMSKPLPLVKSGNYQFVPVNYFFNNDLAYLQGESTGRTYTTSLTKIKAAKYDLKGIEDMVPNLWSPIKVAYDKHALLGTSHWGPKRQRFYGYASKRVSKHDVYSTKRILAFTNVKVNVWYSYGHLEEIEVRRSDQKLYKFKEGDFPRLHLNDIEDMLLLVIQNRLSNLEGDVIVHFAAALRMFTRRIVIQKRVEDLQLGVESYQKKLNISKPRTCKEDLSRRSPYTTLSNPQGVIYEDKLNMKRLMHSDELYKFSDGTL
ncbi:hypothetical protein Tco_0108960 [Tanacetum coccineum]